MRVGKSIGVKIRTKCLPELYPSLGTLSTASGQCLYDVLHWCTKAWLGPAHCGLQGKLEMLDSLQCKLDNVKLLKELPQSELTKIEAMCVWREFALDETVIATDSPPQDAVFFVISGSMRVSLPAGPAGEIAFIDLKQGDVFGELSALDGAGRSAGVIGKEKGVLATLTSAQFNQIVKQHSEISYALLQHLTSIIRRNNARIVDLSTRTDVQRVYTEILRISEPDPSGDGSWLITRMPKHREIAVWAGTSEDSVATALGQLIKVGLAKRRHPSLHIIDRAKVRMLAELG